MRHLHCPFLAAPLFLSLACTVSVNDGTTNNTTTSTADPTSTTNTPPTTGTTGETDPTKGATISTTGATTTGITTGSDTDAGVMCKASSDCAAGESCFAPFVGELLMIDDFTCHAECVDDMGGGNSAMVWCIDSAACCTDGVKCDPEGYCVPMVDTTGTDTDSSSTGDTDGGTTLDIDTVGTTIDTGSTGDTGGGLLPLIVISGFEVSADCMPAVPDDPIAAKWMAIFDNTLGMADYTATVKTATLTYSPGLMEFVQGITVAPTMSGVVTPGKSVVKAQSKTKALMDLAMDCSQCGKPVQLEVVFTVDGQDIPVSADAVMTCAL